MAKCTYAHVEEKTRQHGWFQSQLWLIESILNQRWNYWHAICLNGTIGELPDWKIPQLDFMAHPQHCTSHASRPHLVKTENGREMLEKVGSPAEAYAHTIQIFKSALEYGNNRLEKLIDWWLYAFGDNQVTERPQLSEKAAVLMYSEFELHRLIGNPADWGCLIASEFISAKQTAAWFATPMHVVHLMTEMTIGRADNVDTRSMSVNDPCVGTGGMLLEASNYSLDLSGQDISYLMCSLCRLNGWLFMPWLVWGNKNLIRELRKSSGISEPAIFHGDALAPKTQSTEMPADEILPDEIFATEILSDEIPVDEIPAEEIPATESHQFKVGQQLTLF